MNDLDGGLELIKLRLEELLCTGSQEVKIVLNST